MDEYNTVLCLSLQPQVLLQKLLLIYSFGISLFLQYLERWATNILFTYSVIVYGIVSILHDSCAMQWNFLYSRLCIKLIKFANFSSIIKFL